MAKILFVAEQLNKTFNNVVLGALRRKGHEIEYHEVFNPEEAAQARQAASAADVIVLQNISGLHVYRDRCEVDAIGFARDMASSGKPVIVYSQLLPKELRTQLQDIGITAIDSMDSMPSVLVAAVDKALQSPGRGAGGQSGERGGRQGGGR